MAMESQNIYMLRKTPVPNADMDPSSNVYNIGSYGTTQAGLWMFYFKYIRKECKWQRLFNDYYSSRSQFIIT